MVQNSLLKLTAHQGKTQTKRAQKAPTLAHLDGKPVRPQQQLLQLVRVDGVGKGCAVAAKRQHVGRPCVELLCRLHKAAQRRGGNPGRACHT